MTDQDLRDAVSGLSGGVGQLREAVAEQTANTTALTDAVVISNERAAKDSKTLHRLAILMVAKLVTIALLVVAIVFSIQAGEAVKDCTTPKGKCAARSTAITSQFLASSEYRSERQRLITELPIAASKGDTVRVDALQHRLDELNGKIAATDTAIADIQAQRKATAKP